MSNLGTWPFTLRPQACALGIRKASQQFKSPFNGTAQVVEFVAERWVMSLTLNPQPINTSGTAEAWIAQLCGGANTTDVWHFARPQPLGTMRGTPVLSGSAARGDLTLAVTTTAGATLLAGDMIGVSGQLFQVSATCTASGGGALTVPLVNRVRAALTSSTSVTWNRPTAKFVCLSNFNPANFIPGAMQGAAIDLEEAF